MSNYDQLLQRIATASGLALEDVERKIEAKRAKLSGLISKEGAAQIIAAELGVSLDNELLKISELVEGMKRAHIVGKITKIFPIRTYVKNEREGKIGSFLLGDSSSNVRVVLWDTNHIDLISSEKIKEGDVVEIMNGGVRNGEVHLSAFSDLKMSNEKMDDVKTNRASTFIKIKDARAGSYGQVRATIVQLFDPKYFEDKKQAGKQRALLNIVLDDGSESIRCLLNDEQLKNLGFTPEEIFSLEAFNGKKGLLLGEEKMFTGSFRMNNYFNKLELSAESISNVEVDALIKELESR